MCKNNIKNKNSNNFSTQNPLKCSIVGSSSDCDENWPIFDKRDK